MILEVLLYVPRGVCNKEERTIISQVYYCSGRLSFGSAVRPSVTCRVNGLDDSNGGGCRYNQKTLE